MGSNPKLSLNIIYPYSKFGVKRPKQTKVIERKPQFDAIKDTPARPPTRHPAIHQSNNQNFRWKPG